MNSNCQTQNAPHAFTPKSTKSVSTSGTGTAVSDVLSLYCVKCGEVKKLEKTDD